MLCGVRGRRGVLSYAQPDRQGKAPGGQPHRRRCGVHAQGRSKGGVGARRQGRPSIRRRGGRGGAPAPQKVRPARRARQDGDPFQGRHCRVSPDVPRGRGGRGRRDAAWRRRRRRAPSAAACRRASLPSSLPSGIGGRGLTAKAASGRTASARRGRIKRAGAAGFRSFLPLSPPPPPPALSAPPGRLPSAPKADMGSSPRPEGTEWPARAASARTKADMGSSPRPEGSRHAGSGDRVANLRPAASGRAGGGATGAAGEVREGGAALAGLPACLSGSLRRRAAGAHFQALPSSPPPLPRRQYP